MSQNPNFRVHNLNFCPSFVPSYSWKMCGKPVKGSLCQINIIRIDTNLLVHYNCGRGQDKIFWSGRSIWCTFMTLYSKHRKCFLVVEPLAAFYNNSKNIVFRFCRYYTLKDYQKNVDPLDSFYYI